MTYPGAAPYQGALCVQYYRKQCGGISPKDKIAACWHYLPVRARSDWYNSSWFLRGLGYPSMLVPGGSFEVYLLLGQAPALCATSNYPVSLWICNIRQTKL